jgi:hypothetical protein
LAFMSAGVQVNLSSSESLTFFCLVSLLFLVLLPRILTKACSP